MTEREHTSKQYEQQLRTFKEKLLLIGYKAETAIADATTAMKIVADIERIGDNGVNIACRALEITNEPELKPIIDVPVAAAAAQRTLKQSLDAFVNSDAELARKVVDGDKYIDDVCEQMLRELLTYMFEDPSTISRALRLIFVARNLERVGDHAANIAEMVIFLVQGQDVRHSQAAKA
jgi:phosphate transport system protein